jgi:hypothetical protein
VREIAEGLVLDLPAFPESAAEEMGLVGLALVLTPCGGYVYGSASCAHTRRIEHAAASVQPIIRFLVATVCRAQRRWALYWARGYDDPGSGTSD